MFSSPKISIVICTCNRAELLDECLSTLMTQTIDPGHFEVLVVDNNSTDGTVEVAALYAEKLPFFQYVRETRQGLSFARNKGARSAKAGWIVYLDDDTKTPKTFVERAIFILGNYPFDCFGGVYLPWYKYGRPHWYRDNYVSNQSQSDKLGVLESDYASGGIIAFRKSVIEECGGFPENVGMTGKRLAYGEETYLQKVIRSREGVIGFDPDWKIEHLVNKSKLNPWWFVKSKYAVGRDSIFVYDLDFSLIDIMRETIGGLYFLLIDTMISLFKLSKKDYYWQNMVVDVFAVFAWKFGRVSGFVRKKWAK